MPRNSKCVAGIAATVVAGVILAFGRTDHNRFHLGTEMALEQQKPLRVVCVSDLHGVHLDGSLGELPDGDVLIVAGDIELTSARDARAFKAWLNQQPHRHKIVTFGNMDSWAAATPTEEVEAALAPATVLLDSSADIEGYRFVGSAHTPEFYGVFQLPSQAGAEEHWQALLPPSGRVDVLVTHGPPHGWGDLTRGRHVGDRALLAAVQALRTPPLLWVCGHIHYSYGWHKVPHTSGSTIPLANSAQEYVRTDHKIKPHVFDLQPRAGGSSGGGGAGGSSGGAGDEQMN